MLTFIVIKFNRRTIFLQLVNVILERVHVSQINLIQPCLNEIRTWLNHRDQLLVKSCQSYETTDIMKLNDNMNATSLDKTKSAGYSQVSRVTYIYIILMFSSC